MDPSSRSGHRNRPWTRGPEGPVRLVESAAASTIAGSFRILNNVFDAFDLLPAWTASSRVQRRARPDHVGLGLTARDIVATRPVSSGAKPWNACLSPYVRIDRGSIPTNVMAFLTSEVVLFVPVIEELLDPEPYELTTPRRLIVSLSRASAVREWAEQCLQPRFPDAFFFHEMDSGWTRSNVTLEPRATMPGSTTVDQPRTIAAPA